VKSDEIKDRLRELEQTKAGGNAADVVLASNMISVGMDIPRLGLMLVNGQPKTIAEYIQATSRVGRGRTPGLVLTLYNANKMRDRSRFEGFSTWHRALYRDVEATGVTPFAPRARDKALHAPFVAIVRHLVPGMQDSPSAARENETRIRQVIEKICARVSRVDGAEAEAARNELSAFLDEWLKRGNVTKYWDNWSDNALLIAAETSAAAKAAGFSEGHAKPTPNTLRAVEASTKFVIVEEVAEGIIE
jgi:superfamily II DNA or RNA helicase